MWLPRKAYISTSTFIPRQFSNRSKTVQGARFAPQDSQIQVLCINTVIKKKRISRSIFECHFGVVCGTSERFWKWSRSIRFLKLEMSKQRRLLKDNCAFSHLEHHCHLCGSRKCFCKWNVSFLSRLFRVEVCLLLRSKI